MIEDGEITSKCKCNGILTENWNAVAYDRFTVYWAGLHLGLGQRTQSGSLICRRKSGTTTYRACYCIGSKKIQEDLHMRLYSWPVWNLLADGRSVSVSLVNLRRVGREGGIKSPG